MDLLDATVPECCGDSTISIDLTLRFWQSRASWNDCWLKSWLLGAWFGSPGTNLLAYGRPRRTQI